MQITARPFHIETREELETEIGQLRELVAIPSLSNEQDPNYSMENLIKAANYVENLFKNLGFTVWQKRIHESAPFVIAELITDAALPTILLYSHYDVQPVDANEWDNKQPFVLEERDGRLYGRGASDDKGGIITIVSALGAYLTNGKKLPVNIRILIEGQEEYGSGDMAALVAQEAERLNAAALIVMDGINRTDNTGTLMSSTRGIVNMKLEIEALKQTVHSGIACLAPDPAMALATLIGSLKDPRQIPGFMDDCTPLSDDEKAALSANSQSVDSYINDIGLIQGKLRGNSADSIAVRISEEPSITIINMHAGKPDGGNSVQSKATCTISTRLVPGQDPKKIFDVISRHLQAQSVPYDLEMSIKSEEEGSFAWKGDVSQAFSQKYLQAMRGHFEAVACDPCGGALPLLRILQKAFPHMEMVVPGVEGPNTNAHSKNESQDIGLLIRQRNSLVDFLALAGEAH